jgi:hypothetical protein
MANETKKKRADKPVVPKRKPGEPINRPHLSRANPLADLLFGSLTPEMVAAADRGEEWANEQTDQRSASDQISDRKRSRRSTQISKFSTGAPEGPPESGGVQNEGPPESGGVRVNGFLAFPHALLDQAFAQIAHYSAFKVYLYLYRSAFRWIHNEQALNAKCDIQLAAIERDCAMPNSVVREALKILIRDGWVEVENRPGRHSLYLVNRQIGPPESGGVGPPDSGGDLKNDHERKEDDKERRSSSRKSRDDDFTHPIKIVYEKLTGNTWTVKDTEAYSTIPANMSSNDIERYMRIIHDRTSKQVGSFAYFAKAIIKEQQSPKTRKTNLNKLRKIVELVRTASVGKVDYSASDFREDIKTVAAREGIPYTPDLLEQAMNNHK